MNCIIHDGIKGMKWGVRNGPPYPLDADQHSSLEIKKNPSLRRSIGKTVKSAVHKVHEWRRLQNPKKMTNEELKSRIERLRNEEEFRKLSGKKTKQQRVQIRVAAGEAFVKSFMSKLGVRVGGTGQNLGNLVSNASSKFFESSLAEKKAKRYENKLKALDAKNEYKDAVKKEEEKVKKEKAERKEEAERKKYGDLDNLLKDHRNRVEAGISEDKVKEEINDIIRSIRDDPIRDYID